LERKVLARVLWAPGEVEARLQHGKQVLQGKDWWEEASGEVELMRRVRLVAFTAGRSTVSKRRDQRKKKEKKKSLKHRYARPQDDDGPVVLFSPRGEAKMSEVLLDFIRPYEDTWETEEQFRKLILVAMIAWNATLMPDEEGKKLIEDALNGLPPEAQEDFLIIMRDLIGRKLEFFADNKRMILDYELRWGDGEPFLSVISTLDR
jgi:hypothetical protein